MSDNLGFLADLEAITEKVRDDTLKLQEHLNLAHDLKNRALQQVKLGIRAVKRNDRKEVEIARAEVENCLDRLTRLTIVPRFQIELFIDSVHTELIELTFVERLYPYVIMGVGELGEEVAVSAFGSCQSFWRGLLDVPGELGKLVMEYRNERELTTAEQVAILERLIEVSQRIATTVNSVVPFAASFDISPYERDFRSSFLGRVVGIGSLIMRHKEQLSMLKMMLSHEETLRSLRV
ncbi:MAG TPA: hypothetical protein VNK70_01410 [Candidatus Paceibacterota bacterium]|nr:hypothetical protein [Candidatus Paceibacterota bacterium]